MFTKDNPTIEEKISETEESIRLLQTAIQSPSLSRDAKSLAYATLSMSAAAVAAYLEGDEESGDEALAEAVVYGESLTARVVASKFAALIS